MRKHPSKHPSGEYMVNVHAYNQIAKILVVRLVRDDITDATFTPAGLGTLWRHCRLTPGSSKTRWDGCPRPTSTPWHGLRLTCRIFVTIPFGMCLRSWWRMTSWCRVGADCPYTLQRGGEADRTPAQKFHFVRKSYGMPVKYLYERRCCTNQSIRVRNSLRSFLHFLFFL